MATRFLGPGTLTLEDGTVIERGSEVTLDEKVVAALKKAGLRFSGDDEALAPQSAAENLGQQGTTAEEAAARAGQPGPRPPTQPA